MKDSLLISIIWLILPGGNRMIWMIWMIWMICTIQAGVLILMSENNRQLSLYLLDLTFVHLTNTIVG